MLSATNLSLSTLQKCFRAHSYLFRRYLSITNCLNMKIVGLVSGGKDSCFNLMKCVAEGHEITALANLKPPQTGEMDSFMYQTAGSEMIEAVAQALNLPLYRQEIKGGAVKQGKYYDKTEGDEVEDLYQLLEKVKLEKGVSGVATGAVLSDYQRVRVENVCTRLNLTSYSYLWKYDQSVLLDEMLQCNMNAILVKVACIGLDPNKHLNVPLQSLKQHLNTLKEKYSVHVCGEGGEYESLVLDCPLYDKTIIIDSCRVVEHTKSDIAPVGYLIVDKYHLQDKPTDVTSKSWNDRVAELPMRTSRNARRDALSKYQCENVPEKFIKQDWKFKSTWPEKYNPYITSHNEETFCSLVAPNTGDVGADTHTMMKQLQGILESKGLTTSNIIYVLLYVSDMSQFCNINSVYTQYFGINPPPRICVEGVLPSTSLVHAQILISKKEKETRHVQSISHWAPSCIGPYSQSSQIDSYTFVSGQIPFIPGCMSALPTSFKGHCQYALEHVCSVADVMGTGLNEAIAAHCYVTKVEHVLEAVDAGKKMLPVNISPLVVVVPRLPRDVLAEWHVTFNKDKKTLKSSTAGCNTVGELLKDLPTLIKSHHEEELYYMFYSADSIDIHILCSVLEKTSKSGYIPIPVHSVHEKTTSAVSIACLQVPGYSL